MQLLISFWSIKRSVAIARPPNSIMVTSDSGSAFSKTVHRLGSRYASY